MPNFVEERATQPSGPKLQVILTIVTFATMAAGFVCQRLDAPKAVETALFAAAFLSGAALGVQEGVASLRKGTVDIDLLMVFAAVGAWLGGSPFEGAMLLLLFSLSDILQDFVLDRTRNSIRA